MVRSEKVGILGGTFDPIHVAHLIIAEECRFSLGLNRVFFVPAGTPPHKLSKPITDTEHRVMMTELSIASNPRFFLSRIDIDRPGPCYSVDTVELLKEELGPDVDVYFIIGTDSLMEMPNWHDPKRLLDLCQFAVVGRPHYRVGMQSLEAYLPGISSLVHFVQAPEMSFSSSDIQRRVRLGLPIKYQVLPPVEEFISANMLYR